MAAAKFRIEIVNKITGACHREDCPATTFEEIVGAKRFKFAVHKSHQSQGSLTLSHFATGRRIREITPTEMCAAPEAEPAEHGRYALAKSIAEKGVALFASVLTHAENEASK